MAHLLGGQKSHTQTTSDQDIPVKYSQMTYCDVITFDHLIDDCRSSYDKTNFPVDSRVPCFGIKCQVTLPCTWMDSRRKCPALATGETQLTLVRCRWSFQLRTNYNRFTNIFHKNTNHSWLDSNLWIDDMHFIYFIHEYFENIWFSILNIQGPDKDQDSLFYLSISH